MLKPEVLHLAVVGALLLATSANGDTISTWNGGMGNWSTASNWTPPTVPNNSAGTGYDVTIGSLGTVALDTSPTINSLTVNNGTLYTASGPAQQLTVVNDASIAGGGVFGGILFGPLPIGSPPVGGLGSLSVGGNLNIGPGSSSPTNFAVANGSVVVGGNLTANGLFGMTSSTGNDQLRVGGTLLNQTGGFMFLGNNRCSGPLASCPITPGQLPGPVAGPAVTVGTLVNNGNLYSWSAVTTSTLVNNGLTSLIGGGATVGTVTNGGTIYLSNAQADPFSERTTNLFVGAGATTPSGFGYAQSANGVLNEVLTGSTTYGTIIAGPWTIPGPVGVAGYPVDLNGTLDIMLQNGFVPIFGESFTIITTAPGDISGMFSNVESDSFENGNQLGYFVVSYDNAAGEVIVTAEPVPEPVTAFLFIPALLFVAWCWRRRGTAHFF